MSRTYRTAFSRSSSSREILLIGAFSFGLAASACGGKGKPINGDDAGGTGPTQTTATGDASASTGSTGATNASHVSPSGTVNPGTSKPSSDAGHETAPDATSTANDCGGAGQACCARSTCDDGFVCISEPITNADAGLVVFDAGLNNQRFIDAGGIDASIGRPFPGLDAALELDAGSEPQVPAGVCAPCGGEDERCCSENSCDDGLSCEGSGFGPNASRQCVDDGCGSEGQRCCAGNGPGGYGQCDDELSCNNPPGNMLANSECVAASTVDGGPNADGGQTPEQADAAPEECGGLDQPCCPGRGGQCDDGLECDRRPPQGLEGNVCIEG